jgi:hypothetical protein
MLAGWLAINVVFALLYNLGPGNVTNTTPGSFSDLFFFSIETLATVGYGVMAPATLYGHIISAVEIVTGMAFTAIVTGLLFVRFSRPKAKILAAEDAVVTMHNERPTLMLRIINGRVSIMTNASPLHGYDSETLIDTGAGLLLTIEARDHALIHAGTGPKGLYGGARGVSDSACGSQTWSAGARRVE